MVAQLQARAPPWFESIDEYMNLHLKKTGNFSTPIPHLVFLLSINSHLAQLICLPSLIRLGRIICFRFSFPNDLRGMVFHQRLVYKGPPVSVSFYSICIWNLEYIKYERYFASVQTKQLIDNHRTKQTQ